MTIFESLGLPDRKLYYYHFGFSRVTRVKLIMINTSEDQDTWSEEPKVDMHSFLFLNKATFPYDWKAFFFTLKSFFLL